MGSNIDFNRLWAEQKTGEPNKENLFWRINKYKKINLRRLIVLNLLSVLASLFIIFVWVYYQPQMITTKIGIVLVILAMVIFVSVYNQSFSLFRNTTNTVSNSRFLKDLLKIKAKQQYMQTTMLNYYFLLLSIGIALYLFEYTVRMTALWGIIVYGITAMWILFNWFFLRPKQIKKQQAKIDEIIQNLEMVMDQLEERDKDIC